MSEQFKLCQKLFYQLKSKMKKMFGKKKKKKLGAESIATADTADTGGTLETSSVDTGSTRFEGGKKQKIWLIPSIYLLADFFMRFAILLITFQISWAQYNSSSGYDGIIIFFRTTYQAMIAIIIAIPFACLVDSRIGLLITCLISCSLVFISSILGILGGIASMFRTSEYVYLAMEYVNYTLIIFEPARIVIVLIHSLEQTPKFTKIICIAMVWLRELAVIFAYLCIEFIRYSEHYHYIVNPIAMFFVIVYAVIISTVARVRFNRKDAIMGYKMVRCYITYLPNVNRVKPKYFEPDEKFSLKEKYCTIQFLRIYRALAALIIFYFAQQLLYVVWDFQSKMMTFGSVRLTQSIQFKLAVLNLINIPLIFFGLFYLLAKTKKLFFQNNLKLLGFGYLALLLSLLLTMIGQFYSNKTAEDMRPGQDESFVRIYNMIPQEIKINSSWTNGQKISAFNLYVSDKFNAKGIVSSQLLINGPEPMTKFSKSIFSKEQNSATFVVVSDKMRRVKGYDDVHAGVLDSRGPVSIISTYSTLLREFDLKLINQDTKEETTITFPEQIHLKETHVLPPGEYKIVHGEEEEQKLDIGGAYSIMMYANGTKAFPADHHYMFHKQSEPVSLPLWSLIGLYFLSVATVIEVVLVMFFIVTEAPQAVRVLTFTFYFFNKILGSGIFYLIVYVFTLQNLTMALFITLWIFVANLCFYWAVMIKFKSLRYTPTED